MKTKRVRIPAQCGIFAVAQSDQNITVRDNDLQADFIHRYSIGTVRINNKQCRRGVRSSQHINAMITLINRTRHKSIFILCINTTDSITGVVVIDKTRICNERVNSMITSDS